MFPQFHYHTSKIIRTCDIQIIKGDRKARIGNVGFLLNLFFGFFFFNFSNNLVFTSKEKIIYINMMLSVYSD